MAPCFWPAITLKPMRGRLPVFAHPCQRIGAAEARWAHNPKVLRSKLRFAILSLLSRLAQLVERKTLNLVVVGSSPTVGVSNFFLHVHAQQHQCSFLGSKPCTLTRIPAPVAQLAARGSHNPKVASSILVGSICLYSSVWQSMRLVSARSRVRSSLEAVSPCW